MSRFHRVKNCLPAVLLSLLFHLGGAIPAGVLLWAHFRFGLSVFWGLAAAGIRVAWVAIQTVLFSALAGHSETQPDIRPNRNPYSHGKSMSLPGEKPENHQRR